MSRTTAHPGGAPSAEEELTLRLCGTAERRKNDRAAVERLGRGADPDRLLAFLQQQRLVGLVGARLEKALDGRMPEAFRGAIAEHLAHNRQRGMLFAHLSRGLCESLRDAGIQSVALKGADFAERAHGDLGLRSAQTDIDLLVAPASLQEAIRVLVGEGYRVYDNVDWGGGLPHYHSRLVTFQPVEVCVEVHWRLHWYERRFAEAILARSQPGRDGQRRLQPVDELTSLLLMFARDGYTGLRAPADLAAWWDRHGGDLPDAPLDRVIADHPRLGNPLLAAVDVLEREVGVPARDLVDPSLARPRRVRLARRLASWSERCGEDDAATNVTLNDLLLTPWGAYRTFLRHYYLQPIGHYLLEYGWPADQRYRNRARRAFHVAGRLARSAGRYARRLWQLRGGRSWEPLPGLAARRAQAAAPAARDPRVLIVSPVRNEAAHIERVVRSVAAQTRRPDLWLVADDGSDDGTLPILRSLEDEVPFMQVLELPPARTNGRDRLAEALEARAFNRALRSTDPSRFSHIGKLDGDIELPPDYFERLLERMGRNPRLGIAGGSIVEPAPRNGGWQRVSGPSYHVHGALKLFTRDCFEAVGGIQERLGWDTIDETYARMLGFETVRDLRLLAKHHRPSASADGKLRGRMRHGQCAYVARYSLAWVLARSVKVAVERDPRGISGLAFAWGYLRCALRGAPRVEDEEFKRFVRREHRRRVLRALGLRQEASANA